MKHTSSDLHAPKFSVVSAKLPTFRKKQSESLSFEAEQAVLQVTQTLVEGNAQAGGWHGSVLFTVDLEKIYKLGFKKEPERWFQTIQRSVRLRSVFVKTAFEEIRRRLGEEHSIGAELRFEMSQSLVCVDVEVSIDSLETQGSKVPGKKTLGNKTHGGTPWV